MLILMKTKIFVIKSNFMKIYNKEITIKYVKY